MRRWFALLLATTACGKGCDPEPLPPPPAARAQDPPTAGHPAAAVERAHGVVLPERKTGAVLPALNRLPYRKLVDFQPDRHLVLAVHRDRLRLLDQRLADPALSDERILQMLRAGHDDWQRRAGVAANRLVLAVDAAAPPELAGRVRRLASAASSWRVVALARDGEVLVELLLDPPPAVRPPP